MPIQDAKDIESELRGMLSKNGKDQPDKQVLLGDDWLQDFARIGSLMTDVENCVAHLTKLNTELVTMAEINHLRKKTLGIVPKNKLVKQTFKYTTTSGKQITGKFRRHDNILKQALDVWELKWGFNQGHQEGGLPARTPLLTGFVQADDFRKYLLKHGFHWNDIGVAASHGEFTHRLHWYIICSHSAANPNWLTHTPIELFKKCGEPETVNSKLERMGTIWDRLFDHLSSTSSDGPTKGTEVHFRKAETLHRFLRDPVTLKRSDLWALAQTVDSSAGRVQLINANSSGKNPLDEDLENRQKELGETLIQKGDQGAKIVWQNLQQGKKESLDEYLRLG